MSFTYSVLCNLVKKLLANVDIETKLENYVLLLRTIRKIKLIKSNKNYSTRTATKLLTTFANGIVYLALPTDKESLISTFSPGLVFVLDD